jgi:23S rRNA (uracil-5-)-methyltransferase RumA
MTSKCPNKEKCGSCTWSDVPYKEQLANKLSEINKELADNSIEHECKKIIPSPKIEHYRNRMDFVINFEGKFGLREKGKWWRVIDDHKCFLSHEKIEKAFDDIYNWIQTTELSFYDRKSYLGILRYAVIRSTKKGETMVSIITSSPDDKFNEKKIITQLNKLNGSANIDNLLWLTNPTKSDISFGDLTETLKGNPFIVEEILGNKYKISPNAFFQTNPYVAEKLLETVLNYSQKFEPNKNFLDLYCGSGFFTIPLSARFKNTYGIELSEEAISDAAGNKKQNNSNAIFKAIEAEGNKKQNNSNAIFKAIEAEDLTWKELEFDHVLVDPPRSGLHKDVLQELLNKHPKNIIYVSCNYKKFVQEYKQLSEKYIIKVSTAVDMFPHTPHVEYVALLERSPH